MRRNRLLDLSLFTREVFFQSQDREVRARQGYIAIAFALSHALQQRCLVVAGTRKGDSYLAFFEVVRRSFLATLFFPPDAWLGKDQAGVYGEVFPTAIRYRQGRRYGSFSGSIRSTFEDALTFCEHHSVDMLRIDGLPICSAVRGDFEIASGSLGILGYGHPFESSRFVWIAKGEAARILNPGGVRCKSAPSIGPVHRLPVDCWRFFPGGMSSLADGTPRHLRLANTRSRDEDYGHESDSWYGSVLVWRRSVYGYSWNIRSIFKRWHQHQVQTVGIG